MSTFNEVLENFPRVLSNLNLTRVVLFNNLLFGPVDYLIHLVRLKSQGSGFWVEASQDVNICMNLIKFETFDAFKLCIFNANFFFDFSDCILLISLVFADHSSSR